MQPCAILTEVLTKMKSRKTLKGQEMSLRKGLCYRNLLWTNSSKRISFSTSMLPVKLIRPGISTSSFKLISKMLRMSAKLNWKGGQRTFVLLLFLHPSITMKPNRWHLIRPRSSLPRPFWAIFWDSLKNIILGSSKFLPLITTSKTTFSNTWQRNTPWPQCWCQQGSIKGAAEDQQHWWTWERFPL